MENDCENTDTEKTVISKCQKIENQYIQTIRIDRREKKRTLSNILFMKIFPCILQITNTSPISTRSDSRKKSFLLLRATA